MLIETSSEEKRGEFKIRADKESCWDQDVPMAFYGTSSQHVPTPEKALLVCGEKEIGHGKTAIL